jgi:hypothetical protein
MMPARRGQRVLSLLASVTRYLVSRANAQTLTDTMTFERQGAAFSRGGTGRGPPDYGCDPYRLVDSCCPS